MNQPLDIPQISAGLEDTIFENHLCVLEQTTSTNDEASRRGTVGAPEGTTVFTERQTSGRGRRGASWVSPSRTDLLFSILLRPPFPVELWPRLTHAACLAVAQGIDAFTGARSQIKWPNDVYLEGKKTAGILLESVVGGAEPFAIIGIGLNVNGLREDFPPDLQDEATSVRMVSGSAVCRNQLAHTILRHFTAAYPRSAHGFSTLLNEIEGRSLLQGRAVTVSTGDGDISGQYAGLGPEGELQITHNKRVMSFSSADRVRLTQ